MADALLIIDMQTGLYAGPEGRICIDTTCRVAVELGFSVILPEDGHTCMDTATLSAAAIIEHHNATLAGAFVQRVSAAAISF
jgi:nicotinamidase-related amidase